MECHYGKKKPPSMPATDCATIILAAGSSSRLGTPKQLLMFENKTLLQRAIDEAVSSGIGDVVVVTGANERNIVSSFPDSNVTFIHNDKWQRGMSSSMQAGLLALLSKQPTLSSVVIMLCDQPFVSSSLLKELVQKKGTTGKGIIACMYGDTLGVPALFSNHYFEALLALQGSEGAKKIIMACKDDVEAVSFLLGIVDIDTTEDYEQLIK